ncbi:MAG: transposase domain-containing protein [Pseudomonadota bacterium]
MRAANDCPPNQVGREWFTPTELAELRLPGLPGDKRSINRRAQQQRWASRTGAQGELLARPRSGRGGGLEFHVSLLPADAQLELTRRGIVSAEGNQTSDESSGWAWLDTQPAKVRQQAEERLTIIQEVFLLVDAGTTQTAAVAHAAARHKVGKSTIMGWLAMVRGIERGAWLPALAPRFKGGGKRAEIDPDLWDMLKSDALRLEQPPFSACYERIKRVAAERGLSIPTYRTLKRRFDQEVPHSVQVLARQGADALQRAIPDVRRSVESLHALHAVNIDGHVCNVFTEHPHEEGKIVRPMLIAIQDIYSRKFLAWKLDLSENVVATRLAFADLFRDYGIPKVYCADNSRTFASKALTAGAETRFRGKIIEEEPAGLLHSLNIEIRFTSVAHGQAKPIERAFREIDDHVSKGPECAGAYTGNNALNKPANYGQRAIPWAEFEAILARGITAYNAREGRRGGACGGRSCDATFAESYACSPIRKATNAELRMALLASERKRLNKRTAEIELYGNRYWAPECVDLAGELVTVRFDPDNLHREIHLYDRRGAYLAQADLMADTGFFDQAGAIEVAKRRKAMRRKVREGLEAERTLTAAEIAAAQGPLETPALPEPKVVQPVRHRATAAAAKLKPVPVEHEEDSEIIDAFTSLNLRIVD